MSTYLPAKDPNNVEPYFIVWCDIDSTNDGGTTDDGELQGATISSATWTVPSGITKDSDNTNAVSIKGVSYDANTVATIWLSSGTDGEDYTLACRIVTSDSRTLDKAIIIPCRDNL
jgi:hypothetical protein